MCLIIYGKYVVILTIVLFRTMQALPFERYRRFLTPTTYPVPTIPVNNLLLGGPIASSVPVRCPLKREIGGRRRLLLDENQMRKIYLQEVGSIDNRYLAETLTDARDTIHRLRPQVNRAHNLKQTGILKRINDWLMGMKTNTTNIHLEYIQRKTEVSDLHNAASIRKDRVKRNTDGSVSHVEYCTARGKTTADGFMHMCSSCAMTTVLPDDKFPRYINEVACDTTDCDCFDVRGTAHGKCTTRIHHVKMLRKLTNGCRMTIHSGQQVITDDWEIYNYPLRVGCECVINKLSMFATFIPKPSG